MSQYVELQQFEEDDNSGNAGQLESGGSIPLDDFEGRLNEAEFLFDEDGNIMNPKEGYKKVTRNRFIALIARYPKSLATVFILIPIVFSIAALFFPLQIDFGIDSFRIQDEVVAARWDGLHAAEYDYWSIRDEVDKSATIYSERILSDLKASRYTSHESDVSTPLMEYYYKHKTSTTSSTVNTTDPYLWESKRTTPLTYRKWKMQVVFVVDKDDNVFTPERVQAMMETQIAMTDQSGYHDYCWSDSKGSCQPPESPLLVFYPDWESYTVHNVPLLTQTEIDSGIATILTNGIYGYTSPEFTAGNPSSYLLRIQFNWGTPLRGYNGYSDRRYEQYAKAEKFIVTYIPFFEDYPAPYRSLTIYHGGDWITSAEIRKTFWSDASYAFGSLIVIFLFLWINMGSLFLAVAGIFEIGISFPSVYFVYRAVMGVPFVGILNGVALFIILGIGVDDLFIFYNSFMQGSNIRNLEDRITWTYQKAAKATFLTSLTTAAAFAANAASQIPALRLFGLLMAMMVTVNYLLVVSFFPAILIIWHTDWQKFVRKVEPRWYQSLLQKLSDFEKYLCMTNDTDNDPSTKHLRAAEKFFHKRFAPFIYKARWALIIVLIAVMVGGLIISLKLQPSSTVPKFFDDDNTIQKFLDWDLDGFLNADGLTESTGCSSPYEYRDICGVCGGDGSTCTTTATTGQVTTGQVTTGQATTGQATTGQATTGQATTGQATTGQATTGQVTTGQATTGQATTGQATTGQATTGEATTGQATTGDITTGQATTGQATTGEVTTGQATTGQATTGQVTTGQATTGQATTGQVTTGQVTTGQVTTGQATTGQATTGRATTGQATTGQATTGQATTGQATTGRATTGQSTTGQSTTGHSTTGQSTTGSGGCDGHGSYVDACGVCGGNNACIGCDGVPYSGADYDYCGVCKGNNSCVPPPTDSKRYVTISIVWGIKGIDRSTADVNDVFGAVQGTPIYDSTFDPTAPEAQTAMLDMCIAANNNKDLVQINGRKIMMSSFQAYVNERGYPFPAPSSSFVSLMYSFIDANWDDFKDSVGFLYDGTYPYAVSYIRQELLSSTIFLHESSFNILDEFEKWEDFMKDLNKMAPSTANKAYQTDDIYIRAYTEVAAVNGITQSLIISSAVAIAGLLLFTGTDMLSTSNTDTGNVVVSFIATIILIANIIFLLAFYQLMGWTLGAIEAISITILVGLSVDYLFHIADAYCIADHHSPKPLTRFEKVQMALTEMGMSSLSGAITTVSSGLMLLFCEIQIFYKFGLVIAVTLSVSLVFTFFFLCSLLSVFGPTGHIGDLFWLIKFGYQKVFRKAQQEITKKADYQQASSLWSSKEDASEGKFTIEDEGAE